MFAKRIVVGLTCMVAMACERGLPESEIAARVNDEPISKQEFQEQVDRNMARYRGSNHQLPPSIEVRIKESVLRRMVDDKMIAQKAKSLGVDVTEAELAKKFEEYKGRFRTDQAFQDYLKRSKNTEANMRADLKRNMLRDRVVEHMSGDVAVSDDEVAKYYEDNKQRFMEREQVKASRVLLRVSSSTPDKEKHAVRKRAMSLRAQAAGGADFAALAKEHSNGPQASRGGDLGWFARGRMPAEFDNVAFNLEPGKVSDVVETKMGYEIVKVWDKRPERQRPIDEVKENIKNSLSARKRNEKRRDILRDLKANAKIETLITFDKPKPEPPARVATPSTPASTPPAGTPGREQPPNAPQSGVTPPKQLPAKVTPVPSEAPKE